MIFDRVIWSNGFDNQIEIAFSKFFDMLPSFLKSLIVSFSALNQIGLFAIGISIILLFIKKTRKLGIVMIASLIITVIFDDLIFKNIFNRARPYEDPELLPYLVSITNNGGKVYEIVPTSSSFPSGHTSSAFCIFGGSLFYYLFENKEDRKFNLRFMIFFLVYAILMGLTRILLSHHYATDVIAGMITGTIYGCGGYFATIGSIKLFKYIKDKKSKKNQENI